MKGYLKKVYLVLCTLCKEKAVAPRWEQRVFLSALNGGAPRNGETDGGNGLGGDKDGEDTQDDVERDLDVINETHVLNALRHQWNLHHHAGATRYPNGLL